MNETQRVEEVAKRSHERADTLLARLEAALAEKLRELSRQGGLSDSLEPTAWTRKEDGDG